MASHLRCLLFRENGDFHGRVLARIGGLYKTQNAVNGKIIVLGDEVIGIGYVKKEYFVYARDSPGNAASICL